MDVRTASKAERHFASDIPDIGNAVPDIASVPAATKNRISNTRQAEKEDRVPRFIETSGRIGKGQCHDWHAGLKGFEDNLGRVFRSFRRLTLRRLSESIPSVAADRLRSVNAEPSTRAGRPVNT